MPIDQLSSYINNLRMDLLRESSPVLVGIFTIMFGLFSAESIQRAMQQILPLGVGHLLDDGLFSFAWRGSSMAACFLFLCVTFVHGAAVVIRMNFDGGLLSIYAKTFYVLSLGLAPWCALHIGRMVAGIYLSELRSLVDPVFLLVYGIWLLFLYGVLAGLGRLGW